MQIIFCLFEVIYAITIRTTTRLLIVAGSDEQAEMILKEFYIFSYP